MTTRSPAVVRPADAQWSTSEQSRIGLPIARLITAATHGSEILLGLLRVPGGGVSGGWSFEEEDHHRPGEIHQGPRHETYYVVRGALRLTWGQGSLEMRTGDAVYLPPGHHYRLENLAADEALIVYNVHPTTA